MSEEKRGFGAQGDWRAWLGPALPFLALGGIFAVALCVLVGVVVITGATAPTVTPGLSLVQAQETATAQAVTAHAIQTQQATPPTRLPTLTPSPDATRSAFPFDLLGGEVLFRDYTGCDWLGIAGDVSDLAGDPLTGLRVRVWGGGVDEVTLSGSSPDFGAAGWEVKLGDAPATGHYSVQLLSAENAPLSPAIAFETTDACDSNLIWVQFLQRADY